MSDTSSSSEYVKPKKIITKSKKSKKISSNEEIENFNKNNLLKYNLNTDNVKKYLDNKVEFTEYEVNIMIRDCSSYQLDDILSLLVTYGYHLKKSNIKYITRFGNQHTIKIVLHSSYNLDRDDMMLLIKNKLTDYITKDIFIYTDDTDIYFLCILYNTTNLLKFFDYTKLTNKIDLDMFKQLISLNNITEEELNKFDFKFTITNDLFHCVNPNNTSVLSYLSSYGVEPDINYYKKFIKNINLDKLTCFNTTNINLRSYTEYVFEPNQLIKPRDIKYPTLYPKFNSILKLIYGYRTLEELKEEQKKEQEEEQIKELIKEQEEDQEEQEEELSADLNELNERERFDNIYEYFIESGFYFNSKFFFNKEQSTLLDIPELENKFIKKNNINKLFTMLCNKYYGTTEDLKEYKVYKVNGASVPIDVYKYIPSDNKIEILKTILGKTFLYIRFNKLLPELKIYIESNGLNINKKIYFNTELCNCFGIPEKSYIPASNLRKFMFHKLEYINEEQGYKNQGQEPDEESSDY